MLWGAMRSDLVMDVTMARIQSISPPARLKHIASAVDCSDSVSRLHSAMLPSARRVDPAFVLGALVGDVGACRLAAAEVTSTSLVSWQSSRPVGWSGFFTLPTGRESRIVVSLLITLILLLTWLFHMGWVERRLAVRPSPINRPVFAFVAVMIISYFWSLAFQTRSCSSGAAFHGAGRGALVNVTFPLLLMVANKLNEPVDKSVGDNLYPAGRHEYRLYFTNQTIHDWFMSRGRRAVQHVGCGVCPVTGALSAKAADMAARPSCGVGHSSDLSLLLPWEKLGERLAAHVCGVDGHCLSTLQARVRYPWPSLAPSM